MLLLLNDERGQGIPVNLIEEMVMQARSESGTTLFCSCQHSRTYSSSEPWKKRKTLNTAVSKLKQQLNMTGLVLLTKSQYSLING